MKTHTQNVIRSSQNKLSAHHYISVRGEDAPLETVLANCCVKDQGLCPCTHFQSNSKFTKCTERSRSRK